MGAVIMTVLLALAGCGGMPPPPLERAERPTPPPPSEPYLVLPAYDVLRYSALAKEQEMMLAACGKRSGCEHAHFTLALIALSQSRESAAGHFRRVASGPNASLAEQSQLWLKLLRMPPADDESGPVVYSLMAALVREYLDRELSVQQSMKEQRTAAEETYQQELGVRDQRIKSLSAQLEALKQIDDDIRTKTRPLSPRLPSPSGP
jgi:hypothetical protein